MSEEVQKLPVSQQVLENEPKRQVDSVFQEFFGAKQPSTRDKEYKSKPTPDNGTISAEGVSGEGEESESSEEGNSETDDDAFGESGEAGDSEGEAPVEEAGPSIKAYSGDIVIDIPEDAEIEIKVDGEIMKVKLSDFQKDLSGQKAISKRFNLLDQAKKQVEARESEIDTGFQTIHKLVGEGQAMAAFNFFADKAGLNTQDFMFKFFKEVAEPLETYMKLSPEQQRLWEQQVKAGMMETKYNNLQAKISNQEAEQAALVEVKRVQAEYNIPDQDFPIFYNKTKAALAEGLLPQQPLTADLVGRYYSWITDAELAISAYEKSGAKTPLNEDGVVKLVSDIRYLRSRDGSVEEPTLVDLIVTEEQKRLARLAEKKKPQGIKPPPAPKKAPRVADASGAPQWMIDLAEGR